MSSSTSVTISREAILQRRACPPRRRRPSILTPSPLQIITEEDEYTRSRTPSPTMSNYASSSSSRLTPSVKNRRRHCNLSPSDIQIARDFVGIGLDDTCSEMGEQADRLLLVPPSSARLPKTPSPEPSPDSFRLTFNDNSSVTFPHPPRSKLNVFNGSSSSESSPVGSAMPLTPSSSHEDLLHPQWNSRRGAAVQPLVIQPYFHQGIEIEASVPEVYESWEDKVELSAVASSFSLSPYTSSFFDSSSSSESDSDDDSDIEADSEWYTRELSQIISLEQPEDTQTSRPESMYMPSRRDSLVLPSKRASKRYIPNYPPPPPPRSPAHTRPISAVPSSPGSLLEFPTQYLAPPSPAPSRALSSPRPPPRKSVPVDLEDDAVSAFSFTLYHEEDAAARAVSPAFSQSSFYGAEATYSDNESDFGSPLDTVSFDLDAEHCMMLPLSIPGTPIDLEADIAHGLEELRRAPASPLPPVREDEEEEEAVERAASLASGSSRWSFGIPSPARSFNWGHGPKPSIAFSHADSIDQAPMNAFDEERVLKSKWSSSTLSSIREEHSKRVSSSRLKLGSLLGTSPSKKRTSTASVTPPSSSPSKKAPIPPRPLSPISFMKKRSSMSRKAAMEEYPPISAFTHSVRKMASSSTMSDAGSVESTASNLKRKPIPLELFLRS